MIKEKLSLNSIFTKLYLIYNLYIRSKIYKKRETYSQWGEDVYIKKFFKNKYIGNYLDIGCFHPTMYSNTALLYNLGWSGINIDINPITIKLFNIARSRDKNICGAIKERKTEIRIFIEHFFSPINALRTKSYETFSYKAGDKRYVIKFKKMIKVKTFLFKDLVKKKFDFLNLDIEGFEFDVLKQINFKKFRPKLIAIEIHGNIQLRKNYSVINLLKKNNYKFQQRFGPTCIFIKK